MTYYTVWDIKRPKSISVLDDRIFIYVSDFFEEEVCLSARTCTVDFFRDKDTTGTSVPVVLTGKVTIKKGHAVPFLFSSKQEKVPFSRCVTN